MEETGKDLPDDCWELIVSCLHCHEQWEALSLVSKNLLSITNYLRDTLTVTNPTIEILSKQLHRFQHLKRIDFGHFSGSLKEALVEIAQSGLYIEELDISGASNPPIKLLKELSSVLKNLRVLSCSKSYLSDDDLLVISDSFTSLEELDISDQHFQNITDIGTVALSMKLKLLQKINLTGSACE